MFDMLPLKVNGNHILLLPILPVGNFISYGAQQTMPFSVVFRHHKALDVDVAQVNVGIIAAEDQSNPVNFNVFLGQQRASSSSSRLIDTVTGGKADLHHSTQRCLGGFP
ncbi:MAG: hypothetical protein J7562_08940 [Agrobacterium tumefaciens]|nr:hypothetical protein [Agrobacterium tumefaciens]